ncbi:hypothetical protein [Thauera sinica]|uniref:Uncharacterized protein n=1 Tax=Thauera sinica TaxID=2665146 RepID=A0ABW1ALP9_9RHOO|nr:hypothetical protein [Thauera sp. K11]ATE60822.1 hypothetical protein CCZ27_13500 [Thauera sp. K11]
MITRQTVAAILTTTAIAFSISTPARAVSLAEAYAARNAPHSDSRDNQPLDAAAGEAETRPHACK